MNKPVDSRQGRPITVECSGVTATRLGANLGAEISGVDLRQPLSDEAFNVIQNALVEHELIIFRNQEITSDNLIDFGRRFGELTVHPFAPHDEKASVLIKFRNDENNPPFATDVWHSDETLYWILRHAPHCVGIAFESDPQVYELTKRNIKGLDQAIVLTHGDYELLLDSQPVPSDHVIIVFVAPPWGTALDEEIGLDLRRTTPPIMDIIGRISREYFGHKIVFATQVYEKLQPESLVELRTLLDWSELRVYDLNAAGRNHGLLLGTRGWKPCAER